MTASAREHYIPLRCSALIDFLCTADDLAEDERGRFRRFCRLVTAIHHREFEQRLEELTSSYAPFDPDADTKELAQLSAVDQQRRLNDLYSDFAWLMDRADFRHLSRDDFEPCHQEVSAWGIPMNVDFSAFEHIALFARGDVVQKRARRRWRNFYRAEVADAAVYQRLVLILKMRPHRRIDERVDKNCVYLKLFKDIPKLDIKMLLPGARVHLSLADRSKIGFPLLSGLTAAAWSILKDIGETFERVFTMSGGLTTTIWTLALGGIGYGYRSFYGYMQTKQRYRLNLTQSLYFQNLDNNAGVLFRLLNEAEEQESRQTILAYYFLWRNAGPKGWTRHEAENFAEQFLDKATHLQVSFAVSDAITKLEKLRLVEKCGDQFRAAPLTEALERLAESWDSCFNDHKGPASGGRLASRDAATRGA
jgi:hypothetical protein